MIIKNDVSNNITDQDILIDIEANNRFEKRESKTIDVMNVLKTNEPGKILKLDSDQRVDTRKKRLKANHLPDITIERVILGDDLMPVLFLERGSRTMNSICRIEIMNNRGNTLGYGTGFMASPNLLMTNNHVLKDEENCKNSIAQFNYEKGENFIDKPVISFRLDPDKFFYTNEELDFTLVYVNSRSLDDKDLKALGFLRLIRQTGKAVIGEYVSIIQHPRGNQKQVALRENRVIDVFDNFVHYVTDTQPGSSGSPVFNDQWEVVSLHHSSVPMKDDQGNYLTIDGEVWNDSMSIDKIHWIGNEGIRISSIFKNLNDILSTIPEEQKTILTEFLEISG